MTRYTYRPLEDPHNDIRIVHIRPGARDDAIKLEISHKSLAGVQPRAPRPPVDIERIRASLPEAWWARATHEDWDERVLFLDYRQVTNDFRTQQRMSWNHPDPKFDQSLYRPPESNPSSVGFEALSYVWGSPDKSVSAEVSDGHSSFTLPITPNLDSAIRYLRSSTDQRHMWIDQLCIDQDNSDEKAIQVSRMTQLYALVDRVVVWLGDPSSDSDQAMEILHKLGGNMVAVGHTASEPTPELKEYHPSAEALESLCQLCKRPWFERTWVVQELRLGNRWTILQCGNAVIRRREFNGALNYLVYKGTGLKDLRSRRLFNAVWSELLVPSHGLTFDKLIWMHRHKQCLDPRDKIYGLLGLTQLEFRNAIQPDYSADVEKVYRNATIAEIRASHRLDILRQSLLPLHGIKAHSWVPDWTDDRLSYDGLVADMFCSGNSVAWTQTGHDSTLHCQGVRCDAIAFVGKQIPNPGHGRQHNRIGELVADLATLVSKIRSILVDSSQAQILEGLGFILCLGLVNDRLSYSLNEPTISEVVDWLSYKLGFSSTYSITDDRFIFVEETVAANLRGRHLIVTEKGHPGIGPPGVEIGDQVCILLGCGFPLILRPDSGTSWRLVGSSYINSFEDGKGLLGPLPNGWVSEVTLKLPKFVISFKNPQTGNWVPDDPRLGTMDGDWELLEQDGVEPSPYAVERYKDKTTGEICVGDPRMTPDALLARRCPIETISLV